MNRKEFLRNTGLAMAGLPVINGFASDKHPLSYTPGNIKVNDQSDWKTIAKYFPLNKKMIYLNNGTMGVTPEPVLEALDQSFRYTAENGAYPMGSNELRKALARVLGVEYTSLAITKNVTEGINIACWGQNFQPGDEVLMTTHEHVGGCTAWLYRARTEGIRLRTFELGNTAAETLDHFKKALTPRIKAIAVPHIPCTIGQVLPIREICGLAKERGITTMIDGAHPIGMLRLNITDLGCDYYSGCLHKWLLAPLGMGFVYIRPSRLESTKIHNVGAYSVADFDMTVDDPKVNELVNDTQRFSTGTFCGPLYDASLKAIEWYESIGIDRIEKRVKELSLYTQNALSEMKDEIKILSPVEDISRGGHTTFRFMNKKADGFGAYARNQPAKIITRHIHEGHRDAIRISTHYYNNEKQIDALMVAVRGFCKS